MRRYRNTDALLTPPRAIRRRVADTVWLFGYAFLGRIAIILDSGLLMETRRHLTRRDFAWDGRVRGETMKLIQDLFSAMSRMFAPRDDFKAQLMADLGIKR
jgi:hypothetical protein